MPEVGEKGQEALKNSRVAIVGLGGLGSPIAMYLTAAGVGKLVLIDDDTVSVSNLHRQIIYNDQELGKAKASSAEAVLKKLNPFCTITAYRSRLSAENAGDFLADCNAIVDATDNFAARFAISTIAAKNKVPHIYGAIERFKGQACVFEPYKGTACYKCLHHPGAAEKNNDEASAQGLLGPLPGIIGSIQAMETLKLLIGLPSALSGIMLSADTMSMNFRQIKLKQDPSCNHED